MLKTLESTESLTQSREGVVGIRGSSKVGRDKSELDGGELDSGEVDGSEVEVDEVGKKVQKTSKSKNLSKSKKTVGSSDFFTPGAKLAFTKLRQVFPKAPIFYHFDLEPYIRIETDALDYTIDGVFSQLTSDDLGRWHLMAFFFCKMIQAEIGYKTHDGELLAIVEAFKI